ncbi:hypothetical protein MSAN_01079100 [Mycena sanguinolenta]|uniref:Uncharacterized protein n=1 Tax=Mycena sanguinolenta TaxID=230812 RepID=A0A8H7D9U6_9AGAR|nr:hypothetical protein MSAN_01079100 [Mycena sanguinolenta]
MPSRSRAYSTPGSFYLPRCRRSYCSSQISYSQRAAARVSSTLSSSRPSDAHFSPPSRRHPACHARTHHYSNSRSDTVQPAFRVCYLTFQTFRGPLANLQPHGNAVKTLDARSLVLGREREHWDIAPIRTRKRCPIIENAPRVASAPSS